MGTAETKEKAASGTLKIPQLSLLLEFSEPRQKVEAVQGIAKLLSISEENAKQVVEGSPVVLLSRMTKADIKAVMPQLTELSKTGLQFRVTAQVPEKMPLLLWPFQPSFTKPPEYRTANVALSWDGLRVLCPSCGEPFMFRRMGKPPLKETAIKRPVTPAPPAELPSLGRTAEPARAESAAESSASDTKVEGENGHVVGEKNHRSEEKTNINALKSQLEMLEKEELASDIEPFIEPAEIVSEELESPVEEPDIVEPSPVEGDVTKSGSISLPDPNVVKELNMPEESAPPAEPAPTPPPEDDGERYNVILSKITSKSKRDKALPIIMEAGGYSSKEAEDLMERPMVIAARGLTKGEADRLLNRFKEIQVFGRTTKKR